MNYNINIDVYGHCKDKRIIRNKNDLVELKYTLLYICYSKVYFCEKIININILWQCIDKPFLSYTYTLSFFYKL